MVDLGSAIVAKGLADRAGYLAWQMTIEVQVYGKGTRYLPKPSCKSCSSGTQGGGGEEAVSGLGGEFPGNKLYV